MPPEFRLAGEFQRSCGCASEARMRARAEKQSRVVHFEADGIGDNRAPAAVERCSIRSALLLYWSRLRPYTTGEAWLGQVPVHSRPTPGVFPSSRPCSK